MARSVNSPLFPDHVRTFVFSVHLFRTFSVKRADQRWTFWRPKYLPPISDSTAQIRDTARVKKSGHGPLFPDHVRTFVFFGPHSRKFNRSVHSSAMSARERPRTARPALHTETDVRVSLLPTVACHISPRCPPHRPLRQVPGCSIACRRFCASIASIASIATSAS